MNLDAKSTASVLFKPIFEFEGMRTYLSPPLLLSEVKGFSLWAFPQKNNNKGFGARYTYRYSI
jgi:hypothetical protein